MKPLLFVLGAAAAVAAESLPNRNSYDRVYGETRGTVVIDPAKELPRFPPVEPAKALATWQVKAGFRLELVAHEPAVRDPVAICFDERGRMFVCEMIDYSEERERTPHLGRISCLEDRDGDGVFETSTVFADDLPWPTGLIWANGALFVGATPDIWRLEDHDGDGRAERREKVFTGFSTGLPRLNVQNLINSFQWGPDNRVHVLCAAGNRGKIRALRRPDLPEQEIAARDFWFDPRTFEFGFEPGGAQYGMSLDNWGRKFAASNADHLQFWVHDDRFAGRNPFAALPAPRQSIAADGGAAEVFRISPDEPWRIIRTRLRVGGVWKGPVEGGGRVSGYFTGATGTTVYRGDAYGPEFVNNTFTGDAGGQLIHRKIISADGVSLVGRRPADELKTEFAASTDTWVRVVNFANAPDGCLYVCDMYREVIEHPWSLPDEIKRHLDLNSGNDRGRIYRLVPTKPDWRRRPPPNLAAASGAELVALLAHPNGWHRETAARLLHERHDAKDIAPLAQLFRDSPSALARHHALGLLAGADALDASVLDLALRDAEPRVREQAVALLPDFLRQRELTPALVEALAARAMDADERVRFQTAYHLPLAIQAAARTRASDAALRTSLRTLAQRDHGNAWISAAVLTAEPGLLADEVLPSLLGTSATVNQAKDFIARVLEICTAAHPTRATEWLDVAARPDADLAWLRSVLAGLRRAKKSVAAVGVGEKLAPLFARAATLARDRVRPVTDRVIAVEVASGAPSGLSDETFAACVARDEPVALQLAAIKAAAERADPAAGRLLLSRWATLGTAARPAVITALLTREDSSALLLDAVQGGAVKPSELAANAVQSLVTHRNAALAQRARGLLSSVVPRSPAEIVAEFSPAVELKGDAARGRVHYAGRCSPCHRAGAEGTALGPDLVTVSAKGRTELLTAIVDPNREIAPAFIAYEAATHDGQGYVGVITRDDLSGITLRVIGGAEVPLVRSNLKSLASLGRSLMPEGLTSGLTPQDVADLLTFIESLK